MDEEEFNRGKEKFFKTIETFRKTTGNMRLNEIEYYFKESFNLLETKKEEKDLLNF